MVINARAPMLYFFMPCLGNRIGEGREVGHRDYTLQQVSGISWLLHFFFFPEEINHTKLKRPWGLPKIDLLCDCNQVPSLPGASVCFVLPASFLKTEYFLVCVLTETRARAFLSWALSLADILIMISGDSFRVDGIKVLDFKEGRKLNPDLIKSTLTKCKIPNLHS